MGWLDRVCRGSAAVGSHADGDGFRASQHKVTAGRLSDTPEQRKGCFELAFGNIKPGDAVIVGMYNRFSEQVRENAELVRSLLAGRSASG